MKDLIETIVIVGVFAYIIGLLFAMIIAMIIQDTRWKYAEFPYLFGYPVLLYCIPRDLIVSYNNYLNKNKLKQMNFKILGKAMGFMFLPTLGVLAMLLVGFFDPIAMWDFIKSTGFWAVFIRVVLFLAEVILVVSMYFYYLEEERKKSAMNLDNAKEKREVSDTEYIRRLWNDGKSDSYYWFYKQETNHPDIFIITRKAKNND